MQLDCLVVPVARARWPVGDVEVLQERAKGGAERVGLALMAREGDTDGSWMVAGLVVRKGGFISFIWQC